MIKALKVVGKGVASLLCGAIGLALGAGLWFGYWKLLPQGSPFNDNWSYLATGERVQELDPFDTIAFFISLVVVPLAGAGMGAIGAWTILAEGREGD